MPESSTPCDAAPIRPNAELLAEVEKHSGTPVSRCYQCRKCTNGCPLAFAMDVKPNQVMRMVQLGLADEVLSSHTIWICAACQTCTTRCPNDIDIAHVMDALRQLNRERGVAPSEDKVLKFHNAFLRSVRRYGRVFEAGMAAEYKLATKDFLGDTKVAWEMLKRGKLTFLPKKIKGRREVRKMFDQESKG